MRNKKLIVVALLVLAMTLTMCLTACGGDNESTDGNKDNNDTAQPLFAETDLASVDALYTKLATLLSKNNYTLDTLNGTKIVEHYCMTDTVIMCDSHDVVEYYTASNGKLRVILSEEGKWYYQDREDTFESFVAGHKANAGYVYDKSKASNGTYDATNKALKFDYDMSGMSGKVTVKIQDDDLLFAIEYADVAVEARLYNINTTVVNLPKVEGPVPKEHEKYVTITANTAKPFEGVDRSDLLAIILKMRELAAAGNYSMVQNDCNEWMLYRYCSPNGTRAVAYAGNASYNDIYVPVENGTKFGEYSKKNGEWTYAVEDEQYSSKYDLFEISMSLFYDVKNARTYADVVQSTTYDEATHTISAVTKDWIGTSTVNMTIRISDDMRSLEVNVDMGSNKDNIITYSNFGEVNVTLPEELKTLTK